LNSAGRWKASVHALEVIVQSVDDAVAAEQGGADRLELVRDLGRDGLTPDLALADAICARVRVPVRVMIREEEPFVASSPAVIERMATSAARFARLPIDGLVIGILGSDGGIAADAMRTVLDAAPRCRVTFHRAIEHVRDRAQALSALAAFPPIDRVLSAGGPGDWAARVRTVEEMSAESPSGVRVMMAIGLELNGLDLLRPLEIDAHIGRAARWPQTVDAPVSTEAVRRVKSRLST
jgi:copper homeostasis protein